MSINLHRVENNNIWLTFPCLKFQFICRTWESLTFDMFSEDEEVSIRLRLLHKQGCSPLLGAYMPVQISGDLNCLMSFSQSRWLFHIRWMWAMHVTCDMRHYHIVICDSISHWHGICEIHCDINICAPTGSCGSAHWIRIKGAGDIVTCLSSALSIWLTR